MRVARYALVCCAVLAGIAFAVDFETLQGEWKLVAAIRDGKPLTGQELDARVTIRGDQFTVQGPIVWPLPMGTFSLNDTANPKTIDLKGTGEFDGKTALGIYEVRAGNRVRFTLAPPGAERPAKLGSRPGTGHIFQEWEKVQ